jgi:PPM family protein phosphatase
LISATEIACLNELGRRSNNEDAVAPHKGAATLHDRVFVVCDGVGGENKGEVASAIVADSIQQYLQKLPPASPGEKEIIQKAIYLANEKLADYATTDVSAKRMSTTLALVYLGESAVQTAWCGDTRIHHIRNGRIMWKSQDHSLVSELVSQGELTEEEARSHPKRNIITRSLNALNFNNTVDFHELADVQDGDYFLICTDGFLEHINENAIRDVLSNNQRQDKAKQFLAYCDGVTRDNFSMYLIQVENIVSQAKSRSHAALLWVVLLMIACSLVLWYLF